MFDDPLDINATDAGYPPLKFTGASFNAGAYLDPTARPFVAEKTSATNGSTRMFFKNCLVPRAVFCQMLDDGVVKQRGLNANVTNHVFVQRNDFLKTTDGKELWFYVLIPTNQPAPTNLSNWTTLLTTNSPTLPLNFTDTNAGSFLKRFDRVLLGP